MWPNKKQDPHRECEKSRDVGPYLATRIGAHVSKEQDYDSSRAMSGQNIPTPVQNSARNETVGGFGRIRAHAQYRVVKANTIAVRVRALSFILSPNEVRER